jgi:hypothetical protein
MLIGEQLHGDSMLSLLDFGTTVLLVQVEYPTVCCVLS